MSKFAEKLERVYRGTAPPLGFRKSTEAETPPLLFVATLTKASAADANALAMAGIDAIVVGGKGISAKSCGELIKAIGDVPLGFFLDSTEKDAIAKTLDLGCDFVVFGLKTPVDSVNRDGLGRLLRIEPTMEPGLVKAVNTLPVDIDGVLIASDEPAVTIERLLIYQRFTELLNKPLLVSLSTMITPEELSGLFKAGINGLVLPEGVSAEILTSVKTYVAGLSRTSKRKARAVAILPRVSGELESEVEEEEEEDI